MNTEVCFLFTDVNISDTVDKVEKYISIHDPCLTAL
jgi:hypothetical protein